MSANTINKVIGQYPQVTGSFEFSKAEKGLENAVNIIKSDKRCFILKSYNSKPALEVSVNKYLNNCKIPVPEIYENKSGEDITMCNGKYYVLWQFLNGQPVKNPVTMELAANLALHISNLHNSLLEYPNDEPCELHLDIENQDLAKEDVQLLANLKKLIANQSMKQCVLHSDLTKDNIFVTKDQKKVVGFIDFGDLHKDLLAWDLAVTITHVFITKTNGIDFEGLAVFWDNYNRYISLEDDEIDSIIPMMIMRNYRLHTIVGELLNDTETNNKVDLLSIDRSVMFKIDLIKQNYRKLEEIIRPIKSWNHW